MNLDQLEQQFIIHFGEMGSKWGINRTVRQIYALLYISANALNAEEISSGLGFSRSNVSMGLKELESLNLIRLKHLLGDRRDYFSTPDDLWDIVRTLIEERRKREIEPTLSMLRSMLLEQPDGIEENYAQSKIQEMYDLINVLTNWYNDIKKIDNKKLEQLLNLGSKIYKLYAMKDKLKLVKG